MKGIAFLASASVVGQKQKISQEPLPERIGFQFDLFEIFDIDHLFLLVIFPLR